MQSTHEFQAHFAGLLRPIGTSISCAQLGAILSCLVVVFQGVGLSQSTDIASASQTFGQVGAAAPAPAPSPSPGQIGDDGSPTRSADNYLFTGSFVDTIPIEVPPGIAGLQPQLKLRYNSNGSTTWIGRGWDLSLGTIERSTRNGPPVYGTSDAFIATLNGQTFELVRIPDGTYRAKIEEAFDKFVFQNGAWTVYDKTGTRYFFGQTAQSRVQVSAGTLVWALDRIEDRNSNYLVATYDVSDLQAYPMEILYGGNVVAGRSPDRRIDFNRTTIYPNGAINYSSGYGRVSNWVLQSLKSFVGTQPVWTYEFVYGTSQSTKRPLLRELRRYGLDGITPFPTVKFSYQGSSAPQSVSPRFNVTGDWSNEFIQFIVGDFNGDGIQDYAEVREPPYYAPRSTGSSVNFADGAGHFISAGTIPGLDLSRNADQVVAGDFNADGKTDLAVCRLSGPSGFEGGVYLSQGDGTFYRAGPCPTFANPTVQGALYSGDFNGDGLVDLVAVIPEDANMSAVIFLGNGDGTLRRGATIPYIGGLAGGFTHAVVADFNGDGRSDIAIYRTEWDPRSAVYFSNADGSFLYKGTIPGSVFVSTYDAVFAADVNGDGLSDLLVWDSKGVPPFCPPHGGVCSPGQTDPVVWLSSGSGTFIASGVLEGAGLSGPNKSVSAGDFNGDGFADFMTFGNNGCQMHLGSASGILASNPCPVAPWLSDNRFFLADFTGDSRSDIFVFRANLSQSGGALYLATGDFPDLISQIDNGIGGGPRAAYGYSRSFPNRYLPFVLPVVTKIVNDSGRCTTANDCSATSYNYQGGYFDRYGREFLGFAQVTSTDAAGHRTDNYFLQDKDASNNPVPINALKGRLFRTQRTAANGTPLTADETDWEYLSPWSNVYFIRTKRQRHITLDVSPALTTQVRFEYDDTPSGPGYGNVVKMTYDGNLALVGDERSELIEYAVNTDANLLSLPKRTLLLGPSGETVADTLYFYDGSTGAGVIVHGNPTETRHWLDKPTPKWVVTRNAWNAFGQPTSAIDPLGGKTLMEYDAYQFPDASTNALGQVAKRTFDPRTGSIVSEVDINEQATAYRYDPLNRLVKVIGPLDSDTYPSVAYDYHDAVLGDPTQQQLERQYRQRHGQPDVIWSREFFDGLGRTYRMERKAAGGTFVITETVYNNLGQVARKTTPRFASPPTSPVWTEIGYDALGRITKISQPDGSTTSTQYQGWRTSVQDANGQIHSSDADAFGRIVKRFEPAIPLPTQYFYDAAGNLTALQDSMGKATALVYDTLGRKVSIRDANKGLWSYLYDDNGNLSRQTDARGVQLGFRYDPVNRLIEKKLVADPLLATDQTVGAVLATYIYDEVDTANRPYSKGRLTTTKDFSGTTSFYHDRVGRVVRQVKTIDGNGYEVKTSYNALSDVTQLTYPNGEIVNYAFDDAEHLARVTNATGSLTYASFPQYDAVERPLVLQQAGGSTMTSYNYDPNTQRLGDLRIVLPPAASSKKSGTSGSDPEIWHLKYQYDPMGNIVRIDTDDSTPKLTAQYDPLYRLRTATGAYFGAQQYTYDSLGNLLALNAMSFRYQDPAHPYAVTATSEASGTGAPTVTTYTYDSNGDRLTKTNERLSLQYTYDADGHLSEVWDGKDKDKDGKKTHHNVLAEYSYDGDGGRTKKVTPVGTTRYVGTLFETRPDGSEVVHIQAGGLAICDIISSKGSAKKSLYYLHQDHLGSIWLVSDSTGARVERFEYDPFGATVLASGVVPVSEGFTNQMGDGEVDTGFYFYNARYYDAGLRRFISADTVVPSAHDPQSLNRYAYARNNPLIYKDPTGNSFWSDVTNVFDDALKVVNPILWITSTPMGWSFTASHPYEVATVALVVATAGGASVAAAAGDSFLAGVAESALTGEVVGAATGGRGQGMFSGALRGGIESAVTHGVISGVEMAHINALEEIALKGFVGGVSAEVNGGKFERGFVFSAAAATVELGYQKMAGFRPEAGPGKALPGGAYDPADSPGRRAPAGFNVFGSNPFDNPSGACLQGSACSSFFNKIPGMNAIAGLHDYWMNNVPYNPAQIPWYVNTGSMFAAAPITWGSLLGGQWAGLTTYLSGK